MINPVKCEKCNEDKGYYKYPSSDDICYSNSIPEHYYYSGDSTYLLCSEKCLLSSYDTNRKETSRSSSRSSAKNIN